MIQEFGGFTVRVLGRTAEDGGMLWMASSLSEVGFTVRNAREVKLVLRADDSVTDPEWKHIAPRYCIRLNGRKVRDKVMTETEETVTVFREEAPWTAEVRLIKLSECTQSLMALKQIVTDGKIEPLEDPEQKIEFIGDSITCGYGVEAEHAEDPFSTYTENAEKGYAGILTDELGLNRMLTSFSGHGIVSGYTDDPENQNLSELVPPYYEMVGRSGFVLPSGKTVTDIPWDFSRFQPQRIVINLGTNDLSWCLDRPERKAEFRRLYAEFLKTVRKNNPEAQILCILGAMGEGLNEEMTGAVADYAAETGDTKIRSALLKEQNGEKNGFGANWHPSEKTQRELADTVISLLSEIPG